MNPLIGLVGAYLVAEAYKRVTTLAQKAKWENFVKTHHGEAGAIMTVAGIVGRSPTLALSGVGLMAHDWNDRTKWFRSQH